MRPQSLAVLGLGTLGGSVAAGARDAGVERIAGYATARSDGVRALQSGVITELAGTAAGAVRGADVVVIASAARTAMTLLERIAGRVGEGCLVTDVAAVKAPVVQRAERLGLADRFAGSHPLAASMPDDGTVPRPDRFRDALVYVCPTTTDGGYAAARNIMSFWQDLYGAQAVLIEPAQHDQRLAWSHHLPQAAVFALARALAGSGLPGAAFGRDAREITRAAGTGTDAWADVLLLNRQAVAGALAQAGSELAELQRRLAAGDRDGVQAFLEEAAAFRRTLGE